ncbi:MAG: hypothetical protein A2Y88_11170 [Chloroflexi bacterium RBG_13_48_10]|nr:MAG: hypothetical protein A2Y88_11170 [Chloroflexi bacterium RBG_13_48_10]
MVHALKETHRIVASQGIIIDVRPLSVDVPLEIIFQGGRESAGMIDMSPDRDLDIAADRAIESVLSEHLYCELSVDYFDFAYYWKTIKGMKDDLDEYWKGDVIVSDQLIQQARILFNQKRPQTQLRVGVQMKLGKYIKQL